jgi:hypothetical protein
MTAGSTRKFSTNSATNSASLSMSGSGAISFIPNATGSKGTQQKIMAKKRDSLIGNGIGKVRLEEILKIANNHY